MFLDHALIQVKAGDGGSGCISFRREKYVSHGGPDGGDGGRGGDVVLAGSAQTATLLDFNRRPKYVAGDGRPGEGGKRTGKSGDDLVLEVPLGTTVLDESTGLPLRDVTEDGQSVVVARGGRGGKGNARLKTATNQAPRIAEDGGVGESRTLRLELRLIADVGIVGLPNAGKSTLLGRVSAAHPKVSRHPFTTLAPNLGIVDLDDFSRLVLADMPGLIQGAHEGKGLGDEFLRHIERTRALLYLIDASPGAQTEPVQAYETVREEIGLYRAALLERPFAIAANKMDLPGSEQGADRLEEHLAQSVHRVSAATGAGLPELLGCLKGLLEGQE
jgi:GTP-binding protein